MCSPEASSLKFSASRHLFLGTGLNLLITRSEPTVFENYVHDLYVDEQLVELSLWDTAGVWCGRMLAWLLG